MKRAVTHLRDVRRSLGQRGHTEQIPIICSLDIINGLTQGGDCVTKSPANVTCRDCRGRIND